MAILCDSFESGRPDSAMVPSVCCSVRDETEMHLAHFPVHRILWRTGSDKGEELLDEKWCSPLLEGQQLNPPFCLLPVQLSNFLNYLMDNFTPSSNESKMPILYFLPRFIIFLFVYFVFSDSSDSLDFPTRKSNFAHLQREWDLSGCRVGEVFLLQEHRGAGDLLRTSPHLPSHSGAGDRAGGGLQEQKSKHTPLRDACSTEKSKYNLQKIFQTNGSNTQ